MSCGWIQSSLRSTSGQSRLPNLKHWWPWLLSTTALQNMDHSTQQHAKADVITVKVPEFWPNAATPWIACLESLFYQTKLIDGRHGQRGSFVFPILLSFTSTYLCWLRKSDPLLLLSQIDTNWNILSPLKNVMEFNILNTNKKIS